MPKEPVGVRTDFVQSLERGLAVIRLFSRETPALSLSEVARLTGLTRATARRIVLTLERLGYMRSRDGRFSLTPRVLSIGDAYLSSLNLWDAAQAHMEALVEQTHESCSVATLDVGDIVYVARVPTTRIMTVSIAVGSRLPAYATSLGRVLLADLEPPQLEAFFATAEFQQLTPRTVTREEDLRAILLDVRRKGWALVDQELEDGIRSISAPLRRGSGRTIAAINVSSHAGRVNLSTLRDTFLPLLLQTADEISSKLGDVDSSRWSSGPPGNPDRYVGKAPP